MQRIVKALLGVGLASAVVAAAEVPTPLPRVDPPTNVERAIPGTAPPGAASAPCTELLASGYAEVELTVAASGLSGRALCGDEAPARMSAIRLRGGGRVELRPPVLARCEMALAFASWIRESVAPAATPHDGSLQRIEIAASYSCRPRNNVAGARLSEHGLANAIDIGAIVLSVGGRVGISEPLRPAILFSEMRNSACARFSTVLGPGADAAHAHHLHIDLAKRRNDYRICQWHQADEPMP